MLYSIKDKNNLFNYNIWSAGDYSNTLAYYRSRSTFTNYNFSNEKSFNGDYSIKITMDNSWDWFEFYQPYTGNHSTFEFNVDLIYDCTIRLCGILEYTDGNQTITYLENRNILPNESISFKVTANKEQNKTIKNMGCRIVLINEGTVYADNFSVNRV